MSSRHLFCGLADARAKVTEAPALGTRGVGVVRGRNEWHLSLESGVLQRFLEQLEEDEPKNFPLCGVYTGDEEEESQSDDVHRLEDENG